MRALGDGVSLLRPVLGRRRTDLRAIVKAAGLVTVEDPANADPRFDRTHARALLSQSSWLDPERLAAAAAHLADAEAALDWTADIAWSGRTVVLTDHIELDAIGLPAELVRRLVVRALSTFGCELPSGPDVVRLIARLAAGQTATLGPVKATPGTIWRFEPATSRRSPSSAGS